MSGRAACDAAINWSIAKYLLMNHVDWIESIDSCSTFQLFVPIERTATPISGGNSWFNVAQCWWKSKTRVRFDQFSSHICHRVLIRTSIESDCVHCHNMTQFSTPTISETKKQRINQNENCQLLWCLIDKIFFKSETRCVALIRCETFATN